MMLTLDDIRGYIGGLGITADRNVYIGKLNSKKDHSIGVYHRQGSGPPVMALGDMIIAATTSGASPCWSIGTGMYRHQSGPPMSCMRNLKTYPACP